MSLTEAVSQLPIFKALNVRFSESCYSSSFPIYALSISYLTSDRVFKGKDLYWNAPISKNEMEALITNHVKEYVLINT